MRPTPRSTRRAVIALVACALFAGFVALGSWQVQRRAWKLDLIDRVEARVHAPPVVAPARAPASERWSAVDVANDEYRHVQASGVFLRDAHTFVQAVTERGAGFWLLTPLQLADGSIVIVNRGFVPPESRDRVAAVTGTVKVTGLLRLTEPGGGFLRRNESAMNRWYSRDVQAIAIARGLNKVAPYFIDADADAGAGMPDSNAPVGGLTVIAFTNNHLVYAITWFTLALMVASGGWRLMREEQSDGHD